MVFKLNISNKGKSLKLEVENEEIQGIKIGDKIDGKIFSEDLEGYELEITGTSDKAGFPGLAGQKGPALKKIILKKGKGMKNNQEGLRLRKTVRGNEISADTVQINASVKKEGKKKFEDFFKTEEPKEEAPAEEKKE